MSKEEELILQVGISVSSVLSQYIIYNDKELLQ